MSLRNVQTARTVNADSGSDQVNLRFSSSESEIQRVSGNYSGADSGFGSDRSENFSYSTSIASVVALAVTSHSYHWQLVNQIKVPLANGEGSKASVARLQ